MPRMPKNESKAIDDRTSECLSNWAQRVSRRGMLARVGNLALRLAGVSLLPILPVDRSFAQSLPCNDWQFCYIYGNLCKDCCGSPASAFTCPSCLTRGAFAWNKCCCQGCECKRISYYDCCGSPVNAQACKGEACVRGPQQPAWCSTGEYSCTIIVVGASCTAGSAC